MAARRSVAFPDLDELRYDLGFFVSDAVDFLGISRRTWFRWSESGKAPRWALVALRSLSGDLSHLGWKGWYIKHGDLFHRDLNPRYYCFGPGHLLASVFCDCPAHKEVRRALLDEQQANHRPVPGATTVQPDRPPTPKIRTA